MTALQATEILKGAKHWTLSVGRDGDEVSFRVGGEVLPPGRQRGARPFFGGAHADARDALISGARSMQSVWGDPS